MDRGVQGATGRLSVRVLAAGGIALLAGWAALAIAFVSALLLIFSLNAGENRVVVEDGRRVAHFGLPFRFVTVDVDRDGSRGRVYQLGEEAYYDPWETDGTAVTVSAARGWVCFGLFYAIFAVPILIALARRCVRGRPPRPCARPS